MLFYFAYGSNMSSARLQSRLGPIEVVGSAVVAGYRHRFNKHGSDDSAKGNIEPSSNEVVRGVVYRLDASQTEMLDGIEGGYRRVQISVVANNLDSLAVSYQAVRLSEDLEPTASYLRHYVVGAREHGIADDYLRGIMPSWFDIDSVAD